MVVKQLKIEVQEINKFYLQYTIRIRQILYRRI